MGNAGRTRTQTQKLSPGPINLATTQTAEEKLATEGRQGGGGALTRGIRQPNNQEAEAHHPRLAPDAQLPSVLP